MIKENSTHVLFLYSCRKYMETRLSHQLKTWPSRNDDPRLSIVPVVGGGSGDIVNGVLELRVQDGYWDLIDKTQGIIDWFLANTTADYMIKVDDDVWLGEAIIQHLLVDRSDYSGVVDHGAWYGGPCYKLSRRALENLPRLRSSPVIQAWRPEDVAVGACFEMTGMGKRAIPCKTWWWRGDAREERIAERVDMVFSHTRDAVPEMFKICETHIRWNK